MFHLLNTPGRTAMIEGKEYLFFSGYSYLGMHNVPGFAELVKKGIDRYGWMFPSSRISNTRLDIFDAFEQRLSAITGMEDTVCFSSGFLAGRAVADLLKDTGYSCAPQSHPAICLEKQHTGNFDEWKHGALTSPVILFDSVNALRAEVNDPSFLRQATRRLTCVIDDSHGAGLLNNGGGIGNNLPQGHDYLITYSLSKAYNLAGGAVSCSKEFATQLRKTSFYTAGTSISPAFAWAFLEGQHLYAGQRKKLRKNIETFTKLTNNRFSSHHELPIFVLNGNVDEDKLKESGIIISSFAYPDPEGEKIARVVLNALHTGEDLQRLATALEQSRT